MNQKAVGESVASLGGSVSARISEKRFDRMRAPTVAAVEKRHCGLDDYGCVVIGNGCLHDFVEMVECASEYTFILGGYDLSECPEGVQSNGRACIA